MSILQKNSVLETFSLPSELFISMQYIHDNFENISPSIRTKLNFLATHLLSTYAREDQKTFFSLIRAEKELTKLEDKSAQDLEQLETLSPEIATKVYFDTVNTLFPKSQLALTSLVKRGSLQIRSQTLKLWGERHLELNFGQQVLIIKKTSNRKPDKILDLNTYSLRWLGEVKSRYCFALDSKTQKNHYKCFFIGSETIELARDWHESLRVSMNSCYISSFIEHRNKINRLRRSISPQRKNEEEKRAKREVKTLKLAREEYEKRKNNAFDEKSLDKNLKIPMLSSEDLEISTKTFPDKKIPGSAPHLNSSIFKFDFSAEEDKNDESPTFKVLKSDCMTSPFVEKVNRMSFEDYTNLKKVKMLRCLKIGELFKRSQRRNRKMRKDKSEKIAKIAKILKKRKGNFFFLMVKAEKFSSLHFFHPFYEFQRKTENIKLQLSRNLSLRDNSLVYCFGNAMNFIKKNDNDGCFIDNDVKFSLNFKIFLNKTGWKRISNNENMQLFRNLQRSCRFKEYFSFPKSFQSIVPFFVSDTLYEMWNRNLLKRSVLTSNLNESHISFYEKRTFFKKEVLEVAYIRHYFENKDYFVIHDRSIEFCDVDKNVFCKGDLIRRTVFIDKKYEENNNYTRVLIEIEFINKDLLKNLNMKHYFLQEFKNFIALKKIVKERTSFKRVTSSMTIGMKRPVSCEKKIEKTFKQNVDLEEKRLVIPGKRSLYIENWEEGSQIKLIDDTSLKRNDDLTIDADFLPKQYNKTNAVKIKELSKSNIPITIAWSSLFLDSFDYWKYNKKNGLVLVDKQILNLQNKLIENLKKVYLKEKSFPFSFINLEYPLIYNEPQPLLMKILHPYIVSHEFLIKAADVSVPLDQIKWVITFLISLIRSSLFGLFPINSISGESLKVTLKNNIVFKADIVRISPRQAMVVVSSQYFEVKSTHEIDYILNKTDIRIKMYKNMEITFKKAEGIKFQVTQFPLLSFYDLPNKKRTLHFDGSLLISNKQENLTSVVNFGNHSNDIIIDQTMEDPLEKEECGFSGNIFKEYPIEEEIKDNEVLSFVSGMWMEIIKFDEEAFWRFKQTKNDEELIIEGTSLSRGDWVEARLENWVNAAKIGEVLKGKEKTNRWKELKKLKTSFY